VTFSSSPARLVLDHHHTLAVCEEAREIDILQKNGINKALMIDKYA